MNVMYLSSVVEGTLNIWYDSLGGVSAVSMPVALQENTDTKIVYGHPCPKLCLRTRSQCPSGRREYIRVPYTLISQCIPQSARIKENILMGNLEGKMDLGDLRLDRSKIDY